MYTKLKHKSITNLPSNQKVRSHTFITLCNCISTLVFNMTPLLKPTFQESSFTTDHGSSHGEDKLDSFQMYPWIALDATSNDYSVHGTKWKLVWNKPAWNSHNVDQALSTNYLASQTQLCCVSLLANVAIDNVWLLLCIKKGKKNWKKG